MNPILLMTSKKRTKSNKKEENKNQKNNQIPLPLPTPNTYPSFTMQNKTPLYFTLENEEERKQRMLFENERKIICYETGLELEDILRIEREYCLFGMEGLVKMGNEYFIPDWYEYKLHEYVFRNKKFVQNENNEFKD